MLRPLLLDILSLAIPLAVAAGAFIIGRSFHHWPKPFRAIMLLVSAAAVAVGAVSLARFVPDWMAERISLVGGPTILLSWAALLMLGIVWNVPGRSFSSGFLVVLAAIAFCLVMIESSGRLWWRFCEPESWQRSADVEGCLQQSSGMTCSPAAAVMLLHRYGIVTSEGEMAYLAGTSFFGTDAYAMVRALQMKLRPDGRNAVVRHTDYESCRRTGAPFLAHVRGEFLGHALVVESFTNDRVQVLDPVDGRRRAMTRAAFEHAWDGTAIYVIDAG
jgi:peptidase C39-like protein